MQGLVVGVWRLGFICFGSLEIENPFMATNVFVCVELIKNPTSTVSFYDLFVHVLVHALMSFSTA